MIHTSYISPVTQCAAHLKAVAKTSILAATLSVVCAANAFAGADLFLKFPNVIGDSTRRGHEGDIELKSFATNAFNNVNIAPGGGVTPSRGVCGQVVVTKMIDRASPRLLGLLFTGRRTAGPVTVTFETQVGDSVLDFYKVDLTEVFVSNITQNDSEPDIIKETVTLIARSFVYTYMEQAADGSLHPVKFGWDCALNRAL
jgi:type VI secretion system secreted protein Hcp